MKVIMLLVKTMKLRFLDQHFVPENAIVNTGTTVQWFNGDAGHERTIDVKDTDGNTHI